MPPSAVDWNNFFDLAAYIAIIAVAIVMVAMVYFVIKYRQRKEPNQIYSTNRLIEKPRQRSLDIRFNLNYTFV